MNRQQYLLNKLAEEATEVAQQALKAAQFGLDEAEPEQRKSNAERCHDEIDDMLGVIEMLNEEFGFNFQSQMDRRWAKKDKVNKYAAYSAELGLLKE